MRTRALHSVVAPILVLLLALATLAMGQAARQADAADHLDAPTVKKDGRNDINDVYVFQGQNAGNTVLVMTVNPAAGVLSPTTFRPGTIYQFLIDTTGDAVQDLRYVVKFGDVRADGRQRYSVGLRNGDGDGDDRDDDDPTRVLRRGLTGTTNPLRGGGMAWAGLVDDPFFFDLDAFNTFKSTLLSSGTLGGLAAFCNPAGENFFAGFNASAIVLEVPDAALGGGTIHAWATTRVGEGDDGRRQIERMAIPTMNTVFNHTDATKDAYNRARPRNDVANYTDDVAGLVDLITGLAGTGSPGYGMTVAGLLLPDVLTYDTTSAANFANLNGRALSDDVIDTALSVVANTPLSDCVGSDSAFSASFPYLAPPN